MAIVSYNEYYKDEENGVCELLITQYKVQGDKKSKEQTYRYIIPIEFVDDVKEYTWMIVNPSVTPVIIYEQRERDKSRLGSKKMIEIGLNNITPFIRICSTSAKYQYHVSSKNKYRWDANKHWMYYTNHKGLAIDKFCEEIDWALGY